MRIDVALLGRFEVRVDGRAVSSDRWSRRHSAALVKLLAMTPGRSLHREQVIDALWPELMTDEAAPRLHKASHFARKALGHREAVVLTAETVRLCPQDDVHVDVTYFRRLAEAAVADGSVAAAKGALAVYGGELLPFDVYEAWAEPHRHYLDRLHIELLRQAGDWHRVLADDPFDEQANLALIRRYAESGDRAVALRQFDWLDRVMRHELGLEPSERALDLRRQVLSGEPAAHSAVALERARPPAQLVQALGDLRRQLCAQIHEFGAAYGPEVDVVLAGARLDLVDGAESGRTPLPAHGACCG